MTLKSFFVAGLLLTLGACALPPEYPPFLAPAETGGSAQLGELARVAALSPERRRRELAELDAMRRLDDARRFQLAALLEREDSADALERSLKTLNALGEGDARSQALVDLLKKSLKARLELKEQTARAQELQDKLEQIKALEKSLQQRDGTSRTP
jgi:hypothetical protein